MSREASRALITDESGKRLLLAKRADDDFQGGRWSALGGKVDHGESPEVAVARESLEEAGLVLRGLVLYKRHENDDDWVTYFYEAKATGRIVLDPSEHSEYGYFDIEELAELETAFDHKQTYIDYLESLQAAG